MIEWLSRYGEVSSVPPGRDRRLGGGLPRGDPQPSGLFAGGSTPALPTSIATFFLAVQAIPELVEKEFSVFLAPRASWWYNKSY